MDGTTANAMVVFKPQEVAEFGNKVLMELVAHEIAKEEAMDTIQRAEKVESFIDVELTKVAMFLHNEEHIDLYQLYGNKQQVSALNRAILTEMGVLERTITDDDKVEYAFTDPKLRDTFYFDQAVASIKEPKDEAEANAVEEHRRRRSRRNSLNIRLQKVAKAAVAMIDAGASFEDIVYKENPTTGRTEPVITKGPKEVLGKNDEIVITGKGATVAEGATTSPTLAGLAKLADARHKASSDDASSKGSTEATTKKEGEGSRGTSEEDFLSTANVMITLIKQREGKFSDPEKTALKNILTLAKESGIK